METTDIDEYHRQKSRFELSKRGWTQEQIKDLHRREAEEDRRFEKLLRQPTRDFGATTSASDPTPGLFAGLTSSGDQLKRLISDSLSGNILPDDKKLRPPPINAGKRTKKCEQTRGKAATSRNEPQKQERRARRIYQKERSSRRLAGLPPGFDTSEGEEQQVSRKYLKSCATAISTGRDNTSSTRTKPINGVNREAQGKPKPRIKKATRRKQSRKT